MAFKKAIIHFKNVVAKILDTIVQYRSMCVLYAIASGLLLSLAFPPKLFSGIEFFALVPFIGLLILPLSSRQLFFYAWLSMTAAFAKYLWWYFDLLPISWLDLETTPMMIAVVGLSLFATAGWLALSPALLAILIQRIGRYNFALSLGALFILWPFFEYFRTLSYSLNPYIQGPGHIFGHHAGFMLLAYSIADYPIIRQLAAILGEYGASTIVLAPNLLLFIGIIHYSDWKHARKNEVFAAKENPPRLLTLFLAIFCIVSFILSKNIYEKGTSADRYWRIAVFQTDFPPDGRTARSMVEHSEMQDRKDIIQSLVQKALEESPDIIVFPEGVPSIFETETPNIFTKNLPDPYPSIAEVQTKVGGSDYRLIIDNDLPPQWWDHSHNTTAILDNQSGILGLYDKQFLMPWGEYTPLLTDWVSRRFNYYWDAERYPLLPGKKPGVFKTPLGTIGLLTCSEILSPQLSRKTVRAGAEIIIFSSSTATFRNSERLASQNLAMGKIRAASLQTPIVYAANGGFSFALDKKGDTLLGHNTPGNTAEVISIPRP